MTRRSRSVRILLVVLAVGTVAASFGALARDPLLRLLAFGLAGSFAFGLGVHPWRRRLLERYRYSEVGTLALVGLAAALLLPMPLFAAALVGLVLSGLVLSGLVLRRPGPSPSG